jgi:hypothetical protein
MLKYALPVVATVALHAAVLAVYLAVFHGDLSSLVCVGDERIGTAPYEVVRTSFRNHGYDGQFYYAIARAPFQRHDAGIDFAPMRQSRILYPILSWSVSGGDPRRLLWAMPLVNLLAIAGLAAVGVAVAVRHGLNPWWGFLLPLAVNAGLPMLRDLSDAVSTLAVAALLAAWLFRQPWWVLAPAALAAVLGREQNVPIVLIVLGLAAWRRRWLTAGALAGVLAVWAAWITVLWQTYGAWPFHPTQGAFDRPLSGLALRLAHFKVTSVFALPDALCVSLILLEIGLSVYLIRRKAEPAVVLTALFGALLALMGGDIFYCDFWSYSRVFAMLPLAVWIGCAQTRYRWPLAAMAAQFLVPIAATVREIIR